METIFVYFGRSSCHTQWLFIFLWSSMYHYYFYLYLFFLFLWKLHNCLNLLGFLSQNPLRYLSVPFPIYVNVNYIVKMCGMNWIWTQSTRRSIGHSISSIGGSIPLKSIAIFLWINWPIANLLSNGPAKTSI